MFVPDVTLLFDNFDNRPKKALLPRNVRKSLLDMSWSTIRYSNISKASECGEKFRIELASHDEEIKKTSSIYMLLGSVFHAAFERRAETESMGNDSFYWKQLLTEFLYRDGMETYIMQNGRPVDDEEVYHLSNLMARPDVLDISLRDIILRIHDKFDALGWQVLSTELKLDFVDGEQTPYPITFQGTLDLEVLMPGGMIFIFDIKTHGLWSGYIGGSQSVKKQEWDSKEILYHPQLRHYDFLYQEVIGNIPSGYGLIFPSNVVPYKKSGKDYKAGDPRGPYFQFVPVLEGPMRNFWKNDLISRLSYWASNGFIRQYPTDYGIPTCHKCSYFASCIGNPNSFVGAKQREFLKGFST